MEPTSLGCWEDCVITCGRCLAQWLVLHRCSINSHSHSCSVTWHPSSTKRGKDALAYQNRSISKEFESEVEAFPMTARGGSSDKATNHTCALICNMDVALERILRTRGPWTKWKASNFHSSFLHLTKNPNKLFGQPRFLWNYLFLKLNNWGRRRKALKTFESVQPSILSFRIL